MNNKAQNITIVLIRNHFRMLKNWLKIKENRTVFLFLIIFCSLLISPFSVYFGEQSSINSQAGSILFTLILPIFAASKYLIFSAKADSLLLVLFNKKNLFFSKQLLLSFFSLSVFSLMLLLGIIPHLQNIPILLIIFSEILLLLISSWLLPYFSLKINFKSNVSKSSRLWNFQIKNINLLPVRGIILREFFSFGRENKKFLIKMIVNVSLINIILMLFIINNGKANFLVWAVILQSFIFLTFIINYPTMNNVSLMDAMLCKEFYILKGEFIFWLTLFLIYLSIAVLVYGFILTKILIIPIAITIFLFAIFLCYVLLVRLAYADNEFTRTLIFVVTFIPITIPVFIYNSYRKLKC